MAIGMIVGHSSRSFPVHREKVHEIGQGKVTGGMKGQGQTGAGNGYWFFLPQTSCACMIGAEPALCYTDARMAVECD